MTYSSPLRWPSDVPRHKTMHEHGNFKVGGELAMNELDAELRRFNASAVVITANVGVGARSGRFYTDQLNDTTKDPGVAVFLRRKDRDLVFACDRYARPLANLRALTLSIDAIRTIERYGGGGMEDRALAGFAALPAQAGTTVTHWSVVLGFVEAYEVDLARGRVTKAALLENVEAEYRALAKKHHTDVAGGGHEAMVELNRARDEARKELAS